MKRTLAWISIALLALTACTAPGTDEARRDPRSLRAEVARARAETLATRTRAAEAARTWREDVDEGAHGPRIELDERVARQDDAGLESSVDATPYRGQVIRLTGRLHVVDAESTARLWLRVLLDNGRVLVHDEMADAPVRVGDAQDVELVAAVDESAARIEFGVVLEGPGPFHVGDVTLAAERARAATDPPLLARLTRRQLDDTAVQSVRLRSELLSRFWGRDVFLEAGVVSPPGSSENESLAVVYRVPDFGGSWTDAYTEGAVLHERMRDGAPRLVHVFLEPMCAQGHHGFVDSVNTGPWGEALVSELVPAIEARCFNGRAPRARFVTGVGNGGWSSLWLQVAYPHLFDGAWAVSPAPVDFRSFLGVDVYTAANLYADEAGAEVPLVRDGERFVQSVRGFARADASRDPVGGWLAGFDAVASPRGDDGRPMRLFDARSGAIDSAVARAWRKRDLAATLRERWSVLGPKIAGKLHVVCGELDTYRAEEGVHRMAEDLRELGAEIDVRLVPGRGRLDLGDPDPERWPLGLETRILREMAARASAVAP